MIKIQPEINQVQGTEKVANPAQIIESIEEECERCTPLTPMLCVTNCKLWKIKREFRELYEIIKTSNYMINLLNTLKNKRRLYVLKMLSSQRLSLFDIQQELKAYGYNHSQETIAKEYVKPLIEVGLVIQEGDGYRATIFGSEINELMENFEEIAEIFPTHSECYEEVTLSILRGHPRTYEELKQFIHSRSIARVLQRLQKANLIHTTEDREYVFYFRTRRNPNNLKFSLTERKVYENIPEEGIAAKKLAKKTGISLRRTYKYLRRLRRKKLVFTRKKPKTYTLTEKGAKIAMVLNEIRDLVANFIVATALLTRDRELLKKLMPDTKKRRKRKKEGKALPLTVLAH